MGTDCVDNLHHADWIREMNRMEHESDGPDGRFKLTAWPYQVDPKDEPYKRQEGGSHYHHFAIQPHEYIVRNNIPWSAGNAIKYLTRYRLKGGKQDLLKARHYIDLAIAEEYPD